ncbi:hypothetical protein M404DRAFT_25132 [Pisolithus tinctorius Marx 270]|uniref:Zn(2)-C6 fungal-type domain-containing protein n=1 Tax=Pisolithus tinctorius Marx 270 TaxID=870435 RepID=A0A0C3K8H7_PISTI|nr:hypothetical protein M404DRAFT_25132 [Pisolithus tinctorius Marx 270]
MSICWSRTPYDQDILPDLTRVTSAELQVGSDNDDEAIQGKLAEHKRRKARAQEEAWLEAERQEQAWLEEERAHAEAEVQRIEAACKAEEARKEAESWWADAGCLRCAWTNMPCLRSTDSKKRRMACNQCNELKEHCQWPVEGETSPGASSAGDKGKRKADVIKGAGDKEDDVEEGPSMKKTSAETRTSPVTGDQMECLIKVVEHMADNMAGLATAQKELYETYIKECFEFLAPEVTSDQDTTDEEDWDAEGLDEELVGLREEEEESWSQSESSDQAGAGSTGSQV